MKNYIFLDFDGVLNTEQNIQKLRAEGKPTTDKYGYIFDNVSVANLSTIIKTTNADLIISSSWKFTGLETMVSLWNDRKLPGNVIDITPDELFQIERYNAMGGRGQEIQQWLSRHQKVGDRYAIFDDINDMLPSQLRYFIETNPKVGITAEDAQKAIEILMR